MAFIPCSHKYTTNIPESYDGIEVRIYYDDRYRLVCRDQDEEEGGGRRQNEVVVCTSTTPSDLLDPFCPYCKADVVDNFSNTVFTNYSISNIDSIFAILQQRVYRKYEHLQRLHNQRSTRGGLVGVEILKIVRYYDWPCTRQQLEETLLRVSHHVVVAEDDATTQPRPTPAAKSAIEELERRLGEVRLDEEETEADCVVCLEGLTTNEEKVLRLPCKHVFHQDCVLNWLRTSHLCPLCRFELPVEVS